MNLMEFNFKAIGGFVLVAVVSYLCRPMNDIILGFFVNEKIECPVSGNVDGHDYVDLGLSVQWATCNVGTIRFEDYGDYFAWGETQTKACHFRYNYSRKSDDTATAQWGKSWRMPTRIEWQELIAKCSWKWMTVNGINGYEVTADSGNWIFLPASGFRDGDSDFQVGSFGYYWSSTVKSGPGAYCFSLDSNNKRVYDDYRYYGHSVRPVCGR